MDTTNGPCESLGLLIKSLNRHGETMGMHVLDPTHSVASFKFRRFLVAYSIYMVMTLSSFGSVWDDFVGAAFWFVNFAILLQSVVKLHVFLGHRQSLLQLLQTFQDIYSRAMQQERKRVLDKFLGYSWFAYRAIRTLYFVAVSLLCVSPLIVGYIVRERNLPMALYIPYLDPTTRPGFEINYIMIVYLLYLAMSGLTASESFFVLNILLGISHLTMMNGMVNALSEFLRTNCHERGPDLQTRIAVRIKEIIYEHQEHLRCPGYFGYVDMGLFYTTLCLFLCRFTRLFEEVFSVHALVMVVSSSLMIVVCLAVLVKQFWPLGLVLIVMALSQILFICAMGSAFESSCESFSQALYQMDWYLLSPKHRKYWWLMMQMAQRPHLNTMGGMRPSNLNSFMLVIRNLYSILMMLLKLAD